MWEGRINGGSQTASLGHDPDHVCPPAWLSGLAEHTKWIFCCFKKTNCKGPTWISTVYFLFAFRTTIKYLEVKDCILVFYLGPSEKQYEEVLKSNFQKAIFLENELLLSNYSNIEIIMASTKFLKFAISNDSGVSHMLSTNHCPLIKLFGPKESKKFTPKINNLITISSSEVNSDRIEDIKVSRVISTIEDMELINV